MAAIDQMAARGVRGGFDYVPITDPTVPAKDFRTATAGQIRNGTITENLIENFAQQQGADSVMGRFVDSVA